MCNNQCGFRYKRSATSHLLYSCSTGKQCTVGHQLHTHFRKAFYSRQKWFTTFS